MQRLFIIALTFASLATAHAGILANGRWSPDHCGLKPAPPIIESGSAGAFNQSLAQVNKWQQQAKMYFDCLVKEANEDNNAIAESANAVQAEYRKEVEKINQDAIAAKKKLDSK